MLSSNHLEHVCLLLQLGSKTCRYLVEDDNFVGVYHCFKLNDVERKIIDQKYKDLIAKSAKLGTDPNEYNTPLGNNCKGYISGLGHLEQGYDKDN